METVFIGEDDTIYELKFTLIKAIGRLEEQKKKTNKEEHPANETIQNKPEKENIGEIKRKHE